MYQQALQCHVSSGLLYSCVQSGLAQAYAQCGKEQLALDAIETAHQTFPDHPENDASFLYADFDQSQFCLWEGLTYLALGTHHSTQNERQESQSYYQKAWETFAHIEKDTGPITATARDRTDILHHMAATALVLEDPQQFCCYLEKGMQEMVALGSKRRRKELIVTYMQGRNIWPQKFPSEDCGHVPTEVHALLLNTEMKPSASRRSLISKEVLFLLRREA